MLDKIFENKKSNYKDDVIDIIRLIRSENVGVRTFYSLIKMFGDAGSALKSIQELSVRGGKNKPISVPDLCEIEKEISELNKVGAGILVFNDQKYPSLLLNIPDPPPVISYIGNLDLLNKNCVAIVGSRNASIQSIEFTRSVSKDLGDSGFVVVSGFARGIDSAAHVSCIDTGTIAVLAGGIDHIYPPENKDLYKKISEKGLLLAELKVGTAPLSKHFPQRNRIISGISYALVIMQASLGSGSMITANIALEHNREIFVVPGFPSDPRFKGNNSLIKQGANIIESANDIIKVFNDIRSGYSVLNNTINDDGDVFDVGFVETVSDKITPRMRKSVLDSLSNFPVDISIISDHTEIPIKILFLILLELELAGKVVRVGNKYSIL